PAREPVPMLRARNRREVAPLVIEPRRAGEPDAADAAAERHTRRRVVAARARSLVHDAGATAVEDVRLERGGSEPKRAGARDPGVAGHVVAESRVLRRERDAGRTGQVLRVEDDRTGVEVHDLTHGEHEAGAFERREEDGVTMAVRPFGVGGEVPPLDARRVTEVVARKVKLRRRKRRGRHHPGEQTHISILRTVDHEPFAQPLRRNDLDPDPLRQFHAWYHAARESDVSRPEALALATASPDGRPSARFVLLKSADESGFVFFTGYESRKGEELEANPLAALCFYWHELGRQVRVEGAVERVPAGESDAYFASRPRGAQLSALASRQSEVVSARSELESAVEELQARHGEGDVPRPERWGGFAVV